MHNIACEFLYLHVFNFQELQNMKIAQFYFINFVEFWSGIQLTLIMSSIKSITFVTFRNIHKLQERPKDGSHPN